MTVLSTETFAAIVLTHNSAGDLGPCLEGLAAQRGVNVRILVVDNASAQDTLATMEAAFLYHLPAGVILDVDQATPTMLAMTTALFLKNNVNEGYSAGNNIGARLAIAAGCAAVLILNPDIRISDQHYLARLGRALLADPNCVVAASRILTPSGDNQNPLRELGFWEELLWPSQYLPKPLQPPAYVPDVHGHAPLVVHKLHGCCLMLRAEFLEKIGYLDEGVFLYCEEPILAAQVRRLGKRMMLLPSLSAVHAHAALTKGNSSRRMLTYIRSRLYYLQRYSGYGTIRLAALRASYGLLRLLHTAKAWATDVCTRH